VEHQHEDAAIEDWLTEGLNDERALCSVHVQLNKGLLREAGEPVMTKNK